MNIEKKKLRHFKRMEKIFSDVLKNKKAPENKTADGAFLYSLRNARKEKIYGSIIWDNDYENIVQKYDLVRLFEIPILFNKYMSFERLLDWIKNHKKIPNQNSKDKYERYLGLKLAYLRCAYKAHFKNIKYNNKRCWYPEYSIILKQKNMEYLFEEAKPIIEKVEDLCKFLCKKQLKSSDIKKISYKKFYLLKNLKCARAKKSSLVWRDDFLQLFKKYKVETYL